MGLRTYAIAAPVAWLVGGGLAGPGYAESTHAGKGATAQVQTVTVFAAASLTAAFQQVATAFERGRPRVTARM